MCNTISVLESHILFLVSWNIGADIETNYSADCVLVSSYGVFHGWDGLRNAAELFEIQVPEANLLYTRKSWYAEVAFLEWQANSDKTYIDNGADTYVIRNGKIVIQTSHYTVNCRCS
ncbi:MAG: hypothetical protein Q4F84_09810 [Fibrobacter sp.]|nr:hypothetical protein [Fibrobacter sp.]